MLEILNLTYSLTYELSHPVNGFVEENASEVPVDCLHYDLGTASWHPVAVVIVAVDGIAVADGGSSAGWNFDFGCKWVGILLCCHSCD